MYANLRVSVRRHDGSRSIHSAFQVDIGPTGVTIHLDGCTEEGEPVPAGLLQVAGGNVHVTADF